MNIADEVVLYDTMQYTKNDWRNRNKIKTAQGTQWLTIPIDVKGKMHQKINEATVSEIYNDWREKHWKSIEINYAKAPYFKDFKQGFEDLYKKDKETNLSKINYSFIKLINSILGIKTPIHWSSDFDLDGDRNQRLVTLCLKTNSTDYYTGPSAQGYLDESLFIENNIKVRYLDYSNYPPYTQLYGDFVHEVSILDLIFNEGPNASKFMKSF
jgi:hypothetical protein